MRRDTVSIEVIAQEDGRYSPEALTFIFEALRRTQKILGREPRRGRKRQACHVSGKELCEGIRALALEKFGFMAKTVFEKWGVRTTRDFGEIVYILIRYHLLSKTKSDSINDFDEVYDFSKAFDHPFHVNSPERGLQSSP